MADRGVMWILAQYLEFADCDLNPFASMARIMAFSSRDWGQDREDAWMYGIAVGWGLPALAELAPKHGWTPKTVARLRLLHLAFLRAEIHEEPSHG